VTFSSGFGAVDQVAFSHDADYLAGVVDNRNRTYALLKQKLRDVPDDRAFAYGNHGGNHHITGLHGQNSSLMHK
jgi:hypothetical protein